MQEWQETVDCHSREDEEEDVITGYRTRTDTHTQRREGQEAATQV